MVEEKEEETRQKALRGEIGIYLSFCNFCNCINVSKIIV